MKRMVLYILLGLLSISMVPAQTEASPVTGAYHFGFKKVKTVNCPPLIRKALNQSYNITMPFSWGIQNRRNCISRLITGMRMDSHLPFWMFCVPRRCHLLSL